MKELIIICILKVDIRSTNVRILLIDDDEQLMNVLADKLIQQRYAVDIANTGEMGWEFVLLFNYDLIVLDWMLPDLEGISLCQKIRAEGHKMPILLLTARDRSLDKIKGLDAGADDYMVKPFDFDELTARIRALLRREATLTSPILHWQKLSLDPKNHEVKHQDRLLPLTPKEYGLIELLMRHPQQVFSPAAIIDNLWAGEDAPGEEAVRTHVKGLRQKLKAVGMAKDTIKTVYGVGYRLKSNDEMLTTTNTQATDNGDRGSTNIARVWSQFRDSAFERIAVLEMVTASGKGQLNNELIESARSSAHKLAGSLGSFGFPEGSRIAKQIEILLSHNLERTTVEQITRLTTSLKAELQHQPFEKTVRDALGKNISLLFIDRNHDPKFSQKLVEQANNNGMKTYVASDLPTAKTMLDRESIDALLYKIVFPDGEDLEFLEQLHQQHPQLSIVTIAQSARLLDRLNLVLSGGNLILQHPVEPIEAIEVIVESIENLGLAARVLIVDDDPQVLLSLKISLKPYRFEITTLDKSTQFWTVLENTRPDILILDIDMPDINGIELCQILRSDRHWQHLPVLFLSVHQDEATRVRAFNIGADDYISKPVTGSILANRILNRLRRSRSY